MKLALGLVCGWIFALGLLVAGMTDATRVLAFLDVTGAWDATLAFVMAGAIAVYALGSRLVLRRERPWAASAFHSPTTRVIDGRLLLGAALFGLGWGLSGFCPGPALVSVGSGRAALVCFTLALGAGSWAAGAWTARAAKA